ncbi:PPE domain-containing protein [Mycobacterium leprae]|uniref:PPE domain-containing protein n=2 Tax=Mycobacterium leprae TaxID=1769 RepID=Q50156_MYCLR|nr:u296n [Mycobacterium leprae]AWV48550.1 PPE domain-containing protein [Mycobacterium leprae]OAR20332.1 hypothetical protein A8144_11310 [Mycobacterium leprae 3125609]OAX70656.1 hypothetical protein A3216_10655 [Mycobacterium leprae 7935681]
MDQALQEQWSGQSAIWMAETAENFQPVARCLLARAWEDRPLRSMTSRGAIPEALCGMKSPGEIADNRAQRETLISGLEGHDEVIAAFDSEYERFCA